jgi:meso-butanediol dehydrogenase/(S,S)-butanediol dehydrogenase/diacetyl reductase
MAALRVTSERRAAVVTGGNRGLGRAIASGLAGSNCDVVLGWRSDEATLTATRSALESFDIQVVAVRGDVVDPSTAAELVKAAREELGRLDIWVNNAGVSTLAPLLETPTADMTRMMDVNYFGTFHGLQAAAGAMVAEGVGGRIINVASDLGVQAAPLLAGYSATKFAVVGLTQAAAIELAPHGIRVNAVCPGTVETDMVLSEELAEARWTGATVDAVHRRLLGDVPAGRLCTEADVAALVAWLASAAAEFVTGQAICTNGGSIRH